MPRTHKYVALRLGGRPETVHRANPWQVHARSGRFFVNGRQLAMTVKYEDWPTTFGKHRPRCPKCSLTKPSWIKDGLVANYPTVAKIARISYYRCNSCGHVWAHHWR